MGNNPLPRNVGAVFFLSLLLYTGSVQAIKGCTANSGVFVFQQGDPGYDFAATRGILPEPKPAFIADCTSKEQIASVLQCAQNAGLKVCIRSGGHSFIGLSQCTGVQIDVAKMKSFSFNSGNNQITLGAGNTLGEMFHKTLQASGGERMIGIGLCPSVGIGGYITGGGFNPYSAKTGLTCESLVSAEIVLPNGNFVTASSTQNTELFWATCGGGGGSFGVMHSATLNTHPAGDFNNNVFFRYKWPRGAGGEVLQKHVGFDTENGNLWVRLEASLGDDGVVAYGACWNSFSTENCEQRLGNAAFFNVAGRSTLWLQKSNRVQDFQGFIGPAGNWARNAKTISDEQAFVGTGYDDAQLGYTRLYTSGMYRYVGNTPDVSVFQSIVDAVLDVEKGQLAFMLVQFNPWSGKEREGIESFAMPHRNIDSFIEYIGGKDGISGSALQDTKAELNRVHGQLQNIMKPWLKGVYLNYPQAGMSSKDYRYLYWGQSLQRLGTLRSQLDPNGLFTSIQTLPIGSPGCPGSLQISGNGVSRNINIQGYPQGNGQWEVNANNGGQIGITLSAASCAISTVSINGIPCGTSPPTTPPVHCSDKTQPGQRCEGAPGFPEVPWLGGCCQGECAEDASKGWGKWCPEANSNVCLDKTQPGERCAGAPGFPEVPWLGGCCEGECAEDASKGWGKWCPESNLNACPGKTNPGERCAGAPGFPEVPWLGGCCVGDCVEDPSKGWGKWCPETNSDPSACTDKTQPGQRCAGAPGFPLVPWLGGCCSGECQEDPSKGWGKWCPE